MNNISLMTLQLHEFLIVMRIHFRRHKTPNVMTHAFTYKVDVP